jgi:cyclopropane-fatty-acyl-phospholipid synthase
MSAANSEANSSCENVFFEGDAESIATKICRKLAFRFIKKLHGVNITICENGYFYNLGEVDESLFNIIVYVKAPSFYNDLIFGGSVGAGAAYMKGKWSCSNLTQLVRAMAINSESLDRHERSFGFFTTLLLKAFGAANKNTISGSRKNIQAHYDLGNDLFKLFLDPTMMYSSAIFRESDTPLHQASLFKLDHSCKKLRLKPTDHLIEIGTGWGGMAIHAAKYYGCRVTTTTISKEQFEYAKARIEDEGLAEKITLLLEDYRDISGSFDKLISIEMIEAVGHDYFETYFEKCSSLLKSDGLMLIQAITIDEHRYKHSKNNPDFIQRYIFPGGCLPSISVIMSCIASSTDLFMTSLEDITDDYALTIKHWRQRFLENKEKVLSLGGYDEDFIRLWEYYLCYCEGGFKERVIHTSQLLFEKPRSREQHVVVGVDGRR